MTDNNLIFHSIDKNKIIWPILVIATAYIIMHSGVQRLMQGAAPEDWIVDITLGVLLLIHYFGVKLASWLEHNQSSADRFGLTSWTILITSAIWVTVGAFFLSVGLKTIGVIGFTIFGVIGVTGMLYKFSQP